MEEIIKNLESARALLRDSCDRALSSHEAKIAEARKIWDDILSCKENIAKIDEAIYVLRDSGDVKDRSVKEYNALAELIDSVILWECSYVGGARAADIAKLCEYKFSSYEESFSFISDRTSALSSCGRIKSGRGDCFLTTNPTNLGFPKPISVIAYVNNIRHGYIKLAPMLEPNEKTLRVICERQSWYKKHKYNTVAMSAVFNPSSNIFSMKRKIKKI